MHIYQDEADAFLKAVKDMKNVWVTSKNPIPGAFSQTSGVYIDKAECSGYQYTLDNSVKRCFENGEVRGVLLKDSSGSTIGGSVQISKNEWLLFSNSKNVDGLPLSNLEREAALARLKDITKSV